MTVSNKDKVMDIEKHEFYDQTINFVDVEENGDGKKGLIVIGGKTQFIGIARNDSIALAKHFGEHKSQVDIKAIATKFFYDWYNSPGTNTQQGFDEWWAKNAKEFGFDETSCDQIKSPTASNKEVG